MLIDSLLILLSLALLAIGAEGLVRGSSAIAIRLGMTPMVSGLTIVAFGTSAPEFTVSYQAAINGQGDIALGNAIGSNIFNIGFILALTALIFPIRVHQNIIKFDASIMAFTAIAFVTVMLLMGEISRTVGLMFLMALSLYVFFQIVNSRNESQQLNTSINPSKSRIAIDLKQLLFIAFGLVLLVFGSKLLTNSAVSIANNLGVDEALIGLTIIAAGTSMPELAASIIAAFRKLPDVAVGNIIGSNIFNILCVVGACSLANPIGLDGLTYFDLGAMLFFSLALVPLLLTQFKLTRLEGALLLLFYAFYVYFKLP